MGCLLFAFIVYIHVSSFSSNNEFAQKQHSSLHGCWDQRQSKTARKMQLEVSSACVFYLLESFLCISPDVVMFVCGSQCPAQSMNRTNSIATG